MRNKPLIRKTVKVRRKGSGKIGPEKMKQYINKARTMRKGSRKNPGGGESTHIMRAETDGKGNWFAFPSLFQNDDGSWVDMSGKEFEQDWMPVYEEAKKRGEVFDFGTDKDSALRFGEGSWKPISFKNKSERLRAK